MNKKDAPEPETLEHTELGYMPFVGTQAGLIADLRGRFSGENGNLGTKDVYVAVRHTQDINGKWYRAIVTGSEREVTRIYPPGKQIYSPSELIMKPGDEHKLDSDSEDFISLVEAMSRVAEAKALDEKAELMKGFEHVDLAPAPPLKRITPGKAYPN